jgi:hypothetical protein
MNLSKTVTILLFILLSASTFAQKQTIETITGGYEYWLGLPFAAREQNESIRGDYPVAIWITSKYDTRASVEDQQTGSIIRVIIKKDIITLIPYGDHLMNKVSEQVENKGIHVKSDAPVTVSVKISYKWTGETYRVMPVEMLGKEYVTMNLYQDQLSATGEERSPQILIVATQDKTTIDYTPSTETMKGIKTGETGQVVLNKGETFLILGSIKKGMSQDNSTDLSGTYIKADKPIAVFSGHTKGAFPRYQYTFLGRNGGFMRNLLIDMVLPFELLGKKYISAPILYADRKRGRITDDKGDLIRFVATADDTKISMMKKDGSEMIQISPTLKRGQFFDIVNQEDAALYSANKKVLVAQYGKTWWIHAVHPKVKGNNDEPQNPSRSGQGMLLSLIPFEQWTNYAAWRSPAQIDNFIYITFDKKYLDYIVLDGKKLKESYADNIKNIAGTDYAYLCHSIANGDHLLTVEGLPSNDKNTRIFSCYPYGNWDRSKDGFAYGYPVGINYALDYNDTLMITEDQSDCGVVTVTAEVSSSEYKNANLLNVYPLQLDNYQLKIHNNPEFIPGQNNKVVFTLKPFDSTKYAKCAVKIMTKTGRTQILNYEYEPEKISFEPEYVDFGNLEPDTLVCDKIFEITNSSDKRSLTVHALTFINGNKGFEINYNSHKYPFSLPFTLPPGGRKKIEVCVRVPGKTGKYVTDSLIIEADCIKSKVLPFHYVSGIPSANISDANWENIHVGATVSQMVQIKNESDVELIIYSINWTDTVNFPKVEGLPCAPTGGTLVPPLKIDADKDTSFVVFYRPSSVGNHSTVAIFTANTDEGKLNSVWTGSSYTGVEDNLFSDKFEITPNPATDYIDVMLSGAKHPFLSVKVYDVLGNVVDTPPGPLLIEGERIRLDVSGLAAGVYFVRVGGKMYKFVKL